MKKTMTGLLTFGVLISPFFNASCSNNKQIDEYNKAFLKRQFEVEKLSTIHYFSFKKEIGTYEDVKYLAFYEEPRIHALEGLRYEGKDITLYNYTPVIFDEGKIYTIQDVIIPNDYNPSFSKELINNFIDVIEETKDIEINFTKEERNYLTLDGYDEGDLFDEQTYETIKKAFIRDIKNADLVANCGKVRFFENEEIKIFIGNTLDGSYKKYDERNYLGYKFIYNEKVDFYCYYQDKVISLQDAIDQKIVNKSMIKEAHKKYSKYLGYFDYYNSLIPFVSQN